MQLQAHHANQDYYEVWRNSEEYRAVQSELDWMEREITKKGSITAAEDKHEFSQFNYLSNKIGQYSFIHAILEISRLFMVEVYFNYFQSIVHRFHFLQSMEPRYRVYKIKCWLYSCLRLFSILFYNNIYHLLSSKEICMRPGNAPQGLFLGFHLSSLKYSWKFHGIYWQVLLLILSTIIQLDFTPTRLQLASCHERGALFWLFSCAFYVYVGSVGLLVISFNQVAESAANLASLLFTMSLSFCGVMTTPSAMPRFWIFMYRVSPLTYFIQALLAVGVANVDSQMR